MPTQLPTNVARPTAVLLDIDGTLLDSNDAHTRSWLAALQRHGLAAEYDPVRRMIGKGGDKLLSELFGIEEDSSVGRQITAARRHVFERDFLSSLQPTPGARSLLERLLADGIRLVVATSAGGDELQGLLQRAGVADLIEVAASSSDASQSKPDPDIVQAALDKSQVAACDALMLGDTPYDIEAAGKAGVRAVALRCGGCWDDAALNGAIAIYDDPADLLQHIGTSPFGENRAADNGL